MVGQAQQHCIVNIQEIAMLQIEQGARTIPLAMINQLIDVNTGCFHYVPAELGWYSLAAYLENEDVETIALYAGESTSWQAWQQHYRYQLTMNIIRLQERQQELVITRIISLNRYWFWAMLMSSLTLLWLERKYFS